MLCKAYNTNYGMDIIIVRFFNIYGSHQDFKRFSPPFMSYLATTALRDYVFSADLIALLETMLMCSTLVPGKDTQRHIFSRS
jgi:nucleoside-diphosphate-sugar epimerase